MVFEPHAPEEAAVSVETGNTAVDHVLARLEGLSALPVDQHVAVFEEAHTALRDALR